MKDAMPKVSQFKSRSESMQSQLFSCQYLYGVNSVYSVDGCPGIGRVLRRVLGRAGGVAGLTFNPAAGSVVINADELVAETKRAGFT